MVTVNPFAFNGKEFFRNTVIDIVDKILWHARIRHASSL